MGLLFGQPDRRFQSVEVIRLADSGTGAVHRQLQRLEATKLVLVTREGNQKYYQANRDSPIYLELLHLDSLRPYLAPETLAERRGAGGERA